MILVLQSAFGTTLSTGSLGMTAFPKKLSYFAGQTNILIRRLVLNKDVGVNKACKFLEIIYLNS